MQAHVARRMWRLLEPCYEVIAAGDRKRVLEGIGLRGGWMTYFAARAAPMGPVPGEIVAAHFYVFSPRLVLRAIPDAWAYAPVASILDARTEVIDAVLRRRLGAAADSPEVAEAARLARVAAEACPVGGRPLHDANAALGWPEPAHLQLWQAANLLREFRGDAHMACLCSAGLDGCEANVTLVLDRPEEAYYQQRLRGWDEQDWADATERLHERGLVDAGGSFTPAGRRLRAEVERLTDQHSLEPWAHLGEQGVERLDRLVADLNPLLDCDP